MIFKILLFPNGHFFLMVRQLKLQSIRFDPGTFGAKITVSLGGRLVHKPKRKFDCPPLTGGKSLEINNDGYFDVMKNFLTQLVKHFRRSCAHFSVENILLLSRPRCISFLL